MKLWKVTVEDSYGIIAVHYVEAVFASSAREIESAKGYRVLQVTPCRDEDAFSAV